MPAADGRGSGAGASSDRPAAALPSPEGGGQEIAAVRCQQAWASAAKGWKWPLVLAGLVAIGVLVALGLASPAVINGAVSLWLVRLATLVLVEGPEGLSDHAGAQFWLVGVVVGVGGLVAMLVVLSSDAVVGTVVSWIFLLGAGAGARKPWVRGGRPWHSCSCAAWHLVLLSLVAAGCYGCVLEAFHCPGPDNGDWDLQMPWLSRLEGWTCRCAGDYSGTPGESFRFVDGGGEACYCSVRGVWNGGGEACLRACNVTSGLPPAGSCVCPPGSTPPPAAVGDGSDPRCTPPQPSSTRAANICLGAGGADVVELGDPRCQGAAVVGVGVLLLGSVLVVLTAVEVRRVMHGVDADAPISLGASLLPAVS